MEVNGTMEGSSVDRTRLGRNVHIKRSSSELRAVRHRTRTKMASRNIILFTFACLVAVVLSAPAQENKDLIASEKEDLQTAASHWGGHYGGYGGWGRGYGYYPHYGYGWGYPSYGWYGGWPYGGYYGHGYWW